MTCRGKVSNGTIVLPADITLPEGTEVEVRIPGSAKEQGTFADRFREFIGMADDLPPDLAQNLDHYLHGHPKK